MLDQLARALKPGGVLLVVDHSAKAGTGNADASRLHRIEEAFAKKDIESHGFELVAHSDALRQPADKRDLLSYEGPGSATRTASLSFSASAEPVASASADTLPEIARIASHAPPLRLAPSLPVPGARRRR